MDKLKTILISLNSTEGKSLLSESLATNYPILQQSFEPQIYSGFCGIASSVILVNSAQNFHENAKTIHIFKKQRVTQENIFEVSNVNLLNEWNRGGITLAYLARLIQGALDALKLKAKVSITHGENFANLDEFRKFLEKITSTDGVFAMVNYRRQSIGVGASPHMSPIGAFHKNSDLILVLDTNSTHYEPSWVPLHLMYEAIRTIDPFSKKSRGILFVQMSQ